jgi:hypothetical protein
MEPIAVWVRDDGEWALVHRCVRCGRMSVNRVAGDDAEEVIVELARRPTIALARGGDPCTNPRPS